MSLAAASRSVPQVKVTRTLLFPSDEMEETSSTPGTALMACSTGRVTSSSISSGLAFSYEVEMLRVGKLMSGIRSTGRRVKDTAPRMMTINVAITVNTGRCTENRARFIGDLLPDGHSSRGLRRAPGRLLAYSRNLVPAR